MPILPLVNVALNLFVAAAALIGSNTNQLDAFIEMTSAIIALLDSLMVSTPFTITIGLGANAVVVAACPNTPCVPRLIF